jgi:hypothetical protein
MIVVGIIAAVVLLIGLGFVIAWSMDQDVQLELARENFELVKENAELRAQLNTTVTYYDFGSDR